MSWFSSFLAKRMCLGFLKYLLRLFEVVLVLDVSHLENTLRLAFHFGFELGNLCKGNIGSPSIELLHSEHLTMAWTPSSVLATSLFLEKMNLRGRLIAEWYFENDDTSHS
jgi:hypothetical protein